MLPPPFPKIELHVHLEATVQPRTLIEIARRNGFALPVNTEYDLVQLYRYKDFEHFLDLWLLTTPALQTEADFRQVVIAYGEAAAAQGAVYIEGIFTPVERISGGASWDESSRASAMAQPRPTIDSESRSGSRLTFRAILTWTSPSRPPGTQSSTTIGASSDSGLVVPKRPILLSRSNVPSFWQRTEGSARSHTLEKRPGRSRSAVLSRFSRPTGSDTASEPWRTPGYSASWRHDHRLRCLPGVEFADGCGGSLATHPLPEMLAAGIQCSISTDDPAMFNTDLVREYEVANQLGSTPESAFLAGLSGALCDGDTRVWLENIHSLHPWSDDQVSPR